jgi:lysophospholipase L1-like esterase
MKRFFAVMLAITILVSFVMTSCQKPTQSTSVSEGSVALSSVTGSQSDDSSETSSIDPWTGVGIYDLDEYLHPYWKGDRIYNETVLLREDTDGKISGTLMAAPTLVEVIRDSSLNIVYEEGVDYTIEGDRIIRTEGSEMPYLSEAQIYEDVRSDKSFVVTDSDKFLRLQPQDYTSYYQACIVVTYKHADEYLKEFEAPIFDKTILPKTFAKFEAGGVIKILAFGDSITVGANSSSYDKISPYMKGYASLVHQKLQNTYKKNYITLTTTAQGGKSSDWGAENAKTMVADHDPDLVIIGFGMGDAHAVNNFSPEMLKANIQTIMDTVLATNPECEFIIVSSMMANPVVSGFAGIQNDYPEVLKTLVKEGVAFADVNAAHNIILAKKGFLSIGGNGVNHPNDFIYRLYAQIVLTLLVEDF